MSTTWTDTGSRTMKAQEAEAVRTITGRIFGAALALGEGVAVGTAVVAFLTVLDVIPRVAQATHTRRRMRLYEWAVLIGAVVGSLSDILPGVRGGSVAVVVVVGFVLGTFIGLFTAALAEVLNVIPVFGRRFDMERSIVIFVLALAVGKTLGSLFYWLVPQLRP